MAMVPAGQTAVLTCATHVPLPAGVHPSVAASVVMALAGPAGPWGPCGPSGPCRPSRP
jgi:hypothetical protein